MAERQFEVKVFTVEYACDEPGCDGVMQPGDFVYACSPPKYPHACSKCGAAKDFYKRYPFVKHERVVADKD